MFDMEKIKNLTADEIIIVNGLVDAAREAKEAAKLIRDTYSFGIGEERITIWKDQYNAEYLTHEGVWQARYLHQTYDIKCSEDEIFKYFIAEYLIKNGFAKEVEGCYRTEEGEMKLVCGYFRDFLKVTRQKYEKEQ